MKPKIRVIVPIYNVERYIRKSMESILNQTLKEIEVILINDGSTDRSGYIADEFAAMDKRVKVIHQDNTGVSNSRNKGIEIAQGEYIGFVDPDDWIELEMFEKLYNAATNFNCDIVSFAHLIETEQESTECLQPFENRYLLDLDGIRDKVMKPILCGELLTYCWDKISRTSLIKNNEIRFLEKVHLWEDLYFCMDVFSKTINFLYISLPLYHYSRINEGSLTEGSLIPIT